MLFVEPWQLRHWSWASGITLSALSLQPTAPQRIPRFSTRSSKYLIAKKRENGQGLTHGIGNSVELDNASRPNCKAYHLGCRPAIVNKRWGGVCKCVHVGLGPMERKEDGGG